MPSIICYKESTPDKWDGHFFLVNPDSIMDDEVAASAIAEENLPETHVTIETGGGVKAFVLALRHEGYKGFGFSNSEWIKTNRLEQWEGKNTRENTFAHFNPGVIADREGCRGNRTHN